MQIGDVIASTRRKKRLGQKALAEKLTISVSYLSQVENNSKIPSSKLLGKVAEALEIPLSALLFETIEESEIEDPQNRRAFQAARPIVDKLLSILLTGDMRTEKERKRSLAE